MAANMQPLLFGVNVMNMPPTNANNDDLNRQSISNDIPAVVITQAIDFIYSVQEPSAQWSVLVEGMLDFLSFLGDENGASEPELEHRFLNLLTPHLERVLEREVQLLSQETLLQFQGMVLDRHPLAIGLCETSGEVVWANIAMRRYLTQLPKTRLLHLVSLHTARPCAEQSDIGDDPVRGVQFVAIDVPNLGPTYVVLMASSADSPSLDSTMLKQLFQLTDAEAGIAQRLANGVAPDEIAAVNGTSIGTVRGQVKNVMAKIGATRQPELVATLLSSPASLELPTSTRRRTTLGYTFMFGSRRVGYAEYGAPKGKPIFYLHSWAGSRLEVPQNDEVLRRANVRLIAIERAGMGLSDFVEHDGLYDCPRIVAALADHLGIAEFSVIAFSSGASYAFACAYALPHRVAHVYLASPFTPLGKISEVSGMLSSGKMLLSMAIRMPTLVKPMVKPWLKIMRNRPTWYLESVRADLAPEDEKILFTPEMQGQFTDNFVEAIHRGDQGILQELMVKVSDWSELLDVLQPVTVWHGDADRHLPLALCQKLCAAIPKARLHVVPESGHFLMYHHWTKIVQVISAQLHATSPSAKKLDATSPNA
jgi:pimeloyl-ACP methyl ester carboxylesterase/DNA-binding CsgD family transcriptional regulator